MQKICKNLLQVLLPLALLFFYSCGKKNKIVKNVDNTGTPYSGHIPIAGQDFYDYQSYLQQTPCRQAQGRRNEITFHTNSANSASRTTVNGPFEPGSLPGQISRTYLGKGAEGDVIIVGKVRSGSQIIGHNVTISFCNIIGNNNIPILTNERQLSGFQTNGIVIDDQANCSVGMVDSAYTLVQAAPITYQGQFGPNILSAAPIYTYFFKSGCL